MEQQPTITRYPAIDQARGLAVVGMVIYHLGWDLAIFRVLDPGFASHWAWLWFSYVIAGSFLAIAGLTQAISLAGGFRRRAFIRRFAQVLAGALAITLVTYLVYPDSFIYFGILHHIAAASLLLLFFRKAPALLCIVLGLAVLAAAQLSWPDFFQAVWLAWLGLGESAPVSNDYVPVFPWFSLGLIGLGLGKMLLASSAAQARLQQTVLAGRPGRGLAVMGRHSLLIYLLHQPVLWGGVYLWVQFIN